MAAPPTAPARAALPAISGTFALLAALPIALPAVFALSPIAWRTGSSVALSLPDGPLLDLGFADLARADFGFAFDERARLGAARFFVSAIVPLSKE
jgi:hypothetical protein